MTILDYKDIENPLVILRKSTICRIKGVWYRLITEVNQNLNTTNRLSLLDDKYIEKANTLSNEQLEESVSNGTLLIVD